MDARSRSGRRARGTAACRTRSGDSVPRRSGRSSAVSPPRIVTSSDDSPTPTSVLDFLASEAAPRLAALGTSCPDHFLRTKVRPLLLDLPADSPVEEQAARLRELHAQYRDDYRQLLRRERDAGVAGDARRRSGDRAPSRSRACGASAPTRRRRGWPASSTSTRSTSCAVPRRSRRTSRSRTPRSSASSTGSSRSASSACDRPRRC